MFCTKCGSQVPEGAKFCIICGAPTDPGVPAASAQTTIYADPPPAPIAQPVSKSQYFWKAGPKATKVINIVSILVGLLCILVLLLAVNKSLNGSIFDLPILAIAETVEDLDIRETEEILEDMVDDLENLDEDDERDLSRFEDKYDIDLEYLDIEYGISPDELLEYFDPLSITGMVELAAMAEGDDDETVRIFRIIFLVVKVVTCFLALLAALAVIFRKTWIAVVAYIFSFGLIALTGGILFWILATVTYITSAVLYSKLNGAYKNYLKSF